MSILMSVVFGIVQGVTEFLPVSRSGHFAILQGLFKTDFSADGRLFFEALLNLGTLISLLVFYRKELKSLAKESSSYFRGDSDNPLYDDRLPPPVRMVTLTGVATVPLLLALPFYGRVCQLSGRSGFVGFAFIVTGMLIFVSDKLASSGRKNEKTMTFKDAVIVGIGQAFALIPGLSRSGATITVGLSRGLDRNFSVNFSLLLSILAIAGSFLVSLMSAMKAGINWHEVPCYLVGAAVASIAGYFSIGFLKKVMAEGKFGKFAWYCWAIGAVTVLFSLIFRS